MSLNKKNLLINFLLLFISVVFALLVGEMFLRFFPREMAKGVSMIEDDILMIKAAPNTDWTGEGEEGGYIWDNNGFRNKKVPEKADIVVMGDSMVLGLRAKREEAWPQVLGELTGKEVYQMGHCAYGFPHYYHLIDKAIELEPEKIIISFYVGNDLYDAYNLVYSKDYWKEYRNSEIEKSRINEYDKVQEQNSDIKAAVVQGVDTNSWKFQLLKIRLFVREHSKLYGLLGDGTRAIREKIGLAQSQEDIQMNIQRLGENNPGLAFHYDKEPIQTVLSPQYRHEAFDLDNSIAKDGYRITKTMIEKIDKKLKENNIQLIIAIVPSKELLYAKYMERNNESIPVELKNVSMTTEKLVNDFKNYCDDNQILHHDITMDWLEALKQGRSLFPDTIDSHPNAGGYRVVAESVMKTINIKKQDE